MLGFLDAIALAMFALMVVGAGAVGALLWLIAKSAPALARLLFPVSLLLAGVTIPLGISIFVEIVTGDWVGPHPIYTVGVPGACGVLALSAWGIWRIRSRSRATSGRDAR